MNPTTIALIEERIQAFDDRIKDLNQQLDPVAMAVAHAHIELAVGLGYELGQANPYRA